MDKLIEVKNLYKEYERNNHKFSALNNINFTINSGDFINIIGRSGSGKSTLLNIIAGMLSPTSGNIFFRGQDITSKRDSKLAQFRNNNIGFIPQGASALPNLTILENVLLPFFIHPHNGDGEGYARILLEKFGINHLIDSYPYELSGGELRRALIARALINHPEIIIADEPVSDLDINSAKEVMKIFADLNHEGVTLLIVSHDLESLKYGNEIYTMDNGILHEGNILVNQ